MKIKTVALIGAGAVGAYFIQGLAGLDDIDFTLIAQGDRKIRLSSQGVMINDIVYHPKVKTPQEAYGTDLILIAVKYNAIEEASKMAASMTAEHTMILSVLNGLDSESIVGKEAGMEHMLYSLMRIQAWREGDNILFDPKVTAGLFFGEKSSTGDKSDRVCAVEALFEGTGVRCTYVPNMEGEMWNKYAGNISRNIPQAMLGVGCGAYEDSEHVARISDMLMKEVHDVARAMGIIIPPSVSSGSSSFKTVDRSARFSTLQDLDAGRHTEVEMLLGNLIGLAQSVNVEVPFCTFSYHFIKALEEKNDGKFAY
ncbi:MAG: 2-dehydropantoate 2-reductase [Lachnospiraceae bacterium]|nr:2-dehydropantoate 2-reductase [Lachnospiraceae bacterium]